MTEFPPVALARRYCMSLHTAGQDTMDKWYVEKTVNGWCVMHPGPSCAWFCPDQFGQVKSYYRNVGHVDDPVSYRELQRISQLVRDRSRSYGVKRFGNCFSDDREALCRMFAVELNGARS